MMSAANAACLEDAVVKLLIEALTNAPQEVKLEAARLAIGLLTGPK